VKESKFLTHYIKPKLYFDTTNFKISIQEHGWFIVGFLTHTFCGNDLIGGQHRLALTAANNPICRI